MEERFNIYYELPQIILEIMNWLCHTRFYNKTFIARKEYFQDVEEDWKFCDFEVISGNIKNPRIIKIGEIPTYKGDYEKAIIIDFDNSNNCHIVRGYATGLYASKVIENKYSIPKYMQKDLYNYINNYNKKEVGE